MNALDDVVKHIELSADSDDDRRWAADARAELESLRAERDAMREKISYCIQELDMGDDNRPLEALVRHVKAERDEARAVVEAARKYADVTCETGANLHSSVRDVYIELTDALVKVTK